MKSTVSFFYVTCPDKESAQKISLLILEEKVAACANIFPEVLSTYWWDQKIQTESEVVMIIKTDSLHKTRMIQLIEKNHPYETPCIAEIDISSINKKYSDWLIGSMGK